MLVNVDPNPMPKPYDATFKDLAAQGPSDFIAFLDQVPAVPAPPVRMLNVDLSTVTTAADLVFGLGDPLLEIVHVDAQASASATKHLDTFAYNALLYRTYEVPVHSIVLLLRPEAQHANLTGAVQYAARPGRGKMDFSFEVIRLWEVPVEKLLTGGLATLPLAVLAKLPATLRLEDSLAAVIQQMAARLEQEAPPNQADRLLTAAFVLTGLRLPRTTAFQLFQGVRAMRESDTYQAILDEGREEGLEKGLEKGLSALRRTLLRQGRKRFGEPDEETRQAIFALQEPEHLEALGERLLDVSTWDELLASVATSRR
jgi:predicted transposase YdaD